MIYIITPLLGILILIIILILIRRKNRGWINQEYCSSCDEGLSTYEVMYSYGRCPKCGTKGWDARTIVNTYEKAIKCKYKRPWYIFWERPEIITKN